MPLRYDKIFSTNKFSDAHEKKKSSEEIGHSFEDYFKRTVNPMLVRLLRSDRTMYVYEMASELEMRTVGTHTISFSYPVNYRFVDQRCVREGQKKVSEDNRACEYYVIISEGSTYLQGICNIYIGLSYLRYPQLVNAFYRLERQTMLLKPYCPIQMRIRMYHLWYVRIV